MELNVKYKNVEVLSEYKFFKSIIKTNITFI